MRILKMFPRWSVEIALDFNQVLFGFNWYRNDPMGLTSVDEIWNVFIGPLRIGGWKPRKNAPDVIR